MKLDLRRILSDRRISQSAFADALGISRGYMSLIASGQREPSTALLKQMAIELDLPLGDIFDDSARATGGFAEAAITPFEMEPGQRTPLLRAIGVASTTVDIHQLTRPFAAFSLQKGDRIFVERKYMLAPGDLVIVNHLTEETGALRLARWLDPWIDFAEPGENPLRDGNANAAIMGKVIASIRSY